MRHETAGQMIQVLVRFRDKYKRNNNVGRAHIEAIEEVAARYHVKPQTIRDLCCRRLDLTASKFRHPLERWMLGDPAPLRRLLKHFMPRSSHTDLDAVLGEETGVAIVEEKAPSAIERVVQRLDENFTVSLDPESAKKVRVLALMKDRSAEDWIAESVLKVLEQEYTAWLNSERA